MKRRFLGLILTLFTFSAAQLFAAIDTVTPNEGGFDTEIVITGSGFGDKKPKVYLEEMTPTKPGKPAKVSLKVTEYSETELTVYLKSAKYTGLYRLVIAVKKAEPQTLDNAFEILGPEITSLAPGSGDPDAEITITGKYFGAKKPRVVFGIKLRAKVVDNSDTSVTFLIPKKLGNGVHDVRVENKLGSDTLVDALEVTGSFAAPMLTSISDDEADLEDVLTVNGTDFGDKKPTIIFGEKTKAKVIDNGDTFVTFIVPKKLGAGIYDVSIATKFGSDTLSDAVNVSGQFPQPMIDSLSEEEADPEEEVMIFGEGFTEKPKVTIGAKGKAKVVSSDGTTIVILMPKKIANGIYDVTVTTKHGEDVLAGGIKVVNSEEGLPKKDFFDGTFGDYKHKVSEGPTLNGVYSGTTDTLILNAIIVSASKNATFLITAPVDLSQVPLSISNSSQSTLLVSFIFTTIDISGGFPPVITQTTEVAYSADNNRGNVTVNINAYSAQRCVGTLSGTMQDFKNNTPGEIVNVSAEFAITITES